MGVLDGKVAVVAGASRGIGRGAAIEAALAGATVYVTARTIEPTSSAPVTTTQEIEAHGGGEGGEHALHIGHDRPTLP
jgi:dehydrogenase/reductase SDR family protein 1